MMVNKATMARVIWLQQQQPRTRLGMQEPGKLMSGEFKSKSNALLPISETTITGIMKTGIMVTMVTIVVVVVVVDIVMVVVVVVIMKGNHISKIISMVHQQHFIQAMVIAICAVSIIDHFAL